MTGQKARFFDRGARTQTLWNNRVGRLLRKHLSRILLKFGFTRAGVFCPLVAYVSYVNLNDFLYGCYRLFIGQESSSSLASSSNGGGSGETFRVKNCLAQLLKSRPSQDALKKKGILKSGNLYSNDCCSILFSLNMGIEIGYNEYFGHDRLH